MAISTSAASAIDLKAVFQGAHVEGRGVKGNWGDIAQRASQLAQSALKDSRNPAAQIDQLSGLLKMQVEVTRYQLRVELVSKVSESAVASMRKLQQNQ